MDVGETEQYAKELHNKRLLSKAALETVLSIKTSSWSPALHSRAAAVLHELRPIVGPSDAPWVHDLDIKIGVQADSTDPNCTKRCKEEYLTCMDQAKFCAFLVKPEAVVACFVGFYVYCTVQENRCFYYCSTTIQH